MLNIPNYQMGEKIGQGGMASVYKAKHQHLSKKAEVAVKIMSTAFSSNPLFQKCFKEEAETLDKFTHNNIIKIHDMGDVPQKDDTKIYYIIMEYLSGGTLQTKLTQEGALPFKEVVRILYDLANALQSVHNNGFIHRDIKPANIMFRDSGEVVLTDFGIAKLEGTTGALTKMNLGAGSINYMAPEQFQGDKLDQRVDIYSLGIICYEMLVGKKPFSSDNTSAVLYQQINTKMPRLPKKYARFQPILEKALAKKPSSRYNTATEFVTALEKANVAKKETSYYKFLLWGFFITILVGGSYLLYDKVLFSPEQESHIPPTPSKTECSFTERLNGKCKTIGN